VERASTKESRLGPIDVIRAIAQRNPSLGEYSTRRISPAPMFQQRIPEGRHQDLVARALELKAQTGLSFMDAVNVALMQGAPFDDAVLQGVLFQNREDSIMWHSIDAPPPVLLSNESAMTALTSKVRLRSGEVRHLAMMDFHVPATNAALPLVIEIGTLIGGQGWILESGRSYHYYSARIMSFAEMCEFLGMALLFAPVTDRAWIAHQLVDGVCCLRVAGHPTKIGTPQVVAECEAACNQI
jgi:hypothetical protein